MTDAGLAIAAGGATLGGAVGSTGRPPGTAAGALEGAASGLQIADESGFIASTGRLISDFSQVNQSTTAGDLLITGTSFAAGAFGERVLTRSARGVQAFGSLSDRAGQSLVNSAFGEGVMSLMQQISEFNNF